MFVYAKVCNGVVSIYYLAEVGEHGLVNYLGRYIDIRWPWLVNFHGLFWA